MKSVKGKTIYVLYLFQLILIGIFVLVLFGYQFQTARKTFFENEMFTENVRGLQMSSNQLGEDVQFSLPDLPGQQYMIYRYLSYGTEETVRGIFGTADVFDYTKLIGEGRFFSNDDYRNASLTAVIGSDILKSPAVEEHDGKRFYVYENTPYEVIGVFAKQNHIADKAVFLNLPALDAHISQLGGIYYADAQNAGTVSQVLSQMRADIGNAFTVYDMEFVPTTSRELNRMFRTMFLFCNASAILCLVITTIFLITGQRYSVAVKKLCGMTKGELFLYYGRILLLITVTAFVLIVLLMQLFSTVIRVDIFAESAVSIRHYVMTAVVLVILSVCTTCYITRLSNAVDISSVLKGI